MQPITRRLAHLYKSLRELGPRQVVMFGLYRLQVKSGLMKLRTPPPHEPASAPATFLPLPGVDAITAALGTSGQAALQQEADAIASGRVRLFGGEPASLQLAPLGEQQPMPHWTDYDNKRAPAAWEDVKFVWEPARFGWACTLGRAYFLSGDERYPQAFWQAFDLFRRTNPPYRGPNWISAQEAALRIITFTLAYHLLASSPSSTPERMAAMGQALAEHARRILPSLSYARAQHNNHLLSEAAGLYTAALALPHHPQADSWRKAGWRWFNHGLRTQIENDGTYTQHSLNYHRLMLQLALWMDTLRHVAREVWPQSARRCLNAAVDWLSGLVDPISGRAPNLGPNDGAYILPLTIQPFADLRPVLRAARCALHNPGETPGEIRSGDLRPRPLSELDEMALWLSSRTDCAASQPPEEVRKPGQSRQLQNSGLVLNHPQLDSWAYLRSAYFRGRPGHADQLHLDLWWHGFNLALDPGTYLYNGAPPWDNALVKTMVHNTISVDGRNQMRPAGRFLWLDKVQAQASLAADPDGIWRSAAAVHDGYRHRGVRHERLVEATPSGWKVEDRLLANEELPRPAMLRVPKERARSRPARLRLHWLLPDLPWQVLEGGVPYGARSEQSGGAHALVGLRLELPVGTVELTICVENGSGLLPAGAAVFSLARAGSLLAGSGEVLPTRGWWAPTYGSLQPALSLAVELRVGPFGAHPEWNVGTLALPVSLLTEWRLAERAG